MFASCDSQSESEAAAKDATSRITALHIAHDDAQADAADRTATAMDRIKELGRRVVDLQIKLAVCARSAAARPLLHDQTSLALSLWPHQRAERAVAARKLLSKDYTVQYGELCTCSHRASHHGLLVHMMSQLALSGLEMRTCTASTLPSSFGGALWECRSTFRLWPWAHASCGGAESTYGSASKAATCEYVCLVALALTLTLRLL